MLIDGVLIDEDGSNGFCSLGCASRPAPSALRRRHSIKMNLTVVLLFLVGGESNIAHSSFIPFMHISRKDHFDSCCNNP